MLDVIIYLQFPYLTGAILTKPGTVPFHPLSKVVSVFFPTPIFSSLRLRVVFLSVSRNHFLSAEVHLAVLDFGTLTMPLLFE